MFTVKMFCAFHFSAFWLVKMTVIMAESGGKERSRRQRGSLKFTLTDTVFQVLEKEWEEGRDFSLMNQWLSECK